MVGRRARRQDSAPRWAGTLLLPLVVVLVRPLAVVLVPLLVPVLVLVLPLALERVLVLLVVLAPLLLVAQWRCRCTFQHCTWAQSRQPTLQPPRLSRSVAPWPVMWGEYPAG